MSCSSTCSPITIAMSRSTPPSSSISEPTNRRYWRCGARTIRSSCRRAPWHSSARYPMRWCASSTPGTSRWRLTPRRLRRPFATSCPTDCPAGPQSRARKPEVTHMANLPGPNLPLIVFDVNETVLDLQTMEPVFQRIFGDKRAMRLWFANLIMYSAALTVAVCYVPFTDIGSAVMKMLADTQGIKIDDTDREELKEKFSTMPPHKEVPAALAKLRDAGFRLFTLTDNLLEVQTRQLQHGGIVDFFERRFSADGVKHHKPSRQAYAYVEKELGADASRFCLIACHTWDTLGAVAAGWEAALIKRVGNDVLGVGPPPRIVGGDLNHVADQLIARHKERS